MRSVYVRGSSSFARDLVALVREWGCPIDTRTPEVLLVDHPRDGRGNRWRERFPYAQIVVVSDTPPSIGYCTWVSAAGVSWERQVQEILGMED